MTAQRVQWIRDIWSYLSGQTLPAGMIVVDSTNHRLVVHDGTTVGGTPAPLRKSMAGAPTTADLVLSGEWGIFKNTTSGAVVLAYNDSGTIKSVTLT
jgi:hypothetical protein